MLVIPAVDVLDGGAVRLAQGDYSKRSSFGDPVERVVELADQGAVWVHVVDLDAARDREPMPLALVERLAAVGPRIQFGGGVRDPERASALLGAGVSRVVVGTAASADPEALADIAALGSDVVVVAADHRGTSSGREVMVRGWLEGSGRSLEDVCAQAEAVGAAGVLVTDIGRDGMLTGPDVEGLSVALGATTLPVLASGGVSSLEDLERLSALCVSGRRVAGAIVGRAVLEGRIDLREALERCARSA